MEDYDYVIVGGGLAGASAVKGIREKDTEGSILLVGEEKYSPYNRPPLSKDLLLGDDTVEEIFVEEETFYSDHGVKVKLETTITDVDSDQKVVTDEKGGNYHYGKLLLATGGHPKKLDIPGGDLDGLYYYRYLEDYKTLNERLEKSSSATVIGGGFIGSELAAGLNLNNLDVSIIFPEKYLLQRIFPNELSEVVQEDYESRGVQFANEDLPEKINKHNGKYEVITKRGNTLRGDIVIVGIGVSPAVDLCEHGDFDVFEGIEVNEYLETSCHDVYAAGDNAYFPFAVLEDCVRIEHWDNAIHQGKLAGKNMAGANEPYNYIPYFYSDLFDLGFEALGDIDTHLNTVIDWKNEGQKGVVYYLSEDGVVRGVLLVGIWGKKDEARQLIRRKECFRKEDLIGAIG